MLQIYKYQMTIAFSSYFLTIKPIFFKTTMNTEIITKNTRSLKETSASNFIN